MLAVEERFYSSNVSSGRKSKNERVLSNSASRYAPNFQWNYRVFAITATHTTSTVMVNGQAVAFEAYNSAGNNYFKLRDLAKVLSGTTKQFEVGWDANNNAIDLVPGKEYTPVGGELTSSGNTGNQSAILSTSAVYFDGIKIAYSLQHFGYNYFKLRCWGVLLISVLVGTERLAQ